MPFIEEKRVIQAPTNYAPVDEPDADPSLGQTFGAAFRTQNVIGSYLTSRGQPDPYEIEDGFDAIDYIKDDAKLAPYAEQFAGVFNRKAAEAKKAQIFREQADRRTLDAAGGMGTIAELAAGVFDAPTFLAPGGFLVGSAKGVAGTVGRMAVAGGLDAATSEVALQATQETRTGAETALNVGGSVILSGALGGLIGRYLAPHEIKPLADKIERQNNEFSNFDNEVFGTSTGASSAGAAARDAGPLRLKDEGIISKLPIINQQDPLIRSQLSDFDSVRQTVRGLAETPLEYEANAQGIATETRGSVETRMKLWRAPEAQTLSEIDRIYAGYYHGTPEPSSVQMALAPVRSEMQRLTGGDKLTFKQFKEEVGRAAYSGEQHPVPQVAEAAKAYRAIDDKMKQAAIEARLLPEDIAVQKDVSHIFRMYNREKIIAQRDRFTAILSDHFIKGRDSAVLRAEENKVGQDVVAYDKATERYSSATTRMGSLEGRLGERAAVRRQKLSDLKGLSADRMTALNSRLQSDIINALKGADEGKAATAAIKEGREASRRVAKKEPYAEKFPVLAVLKEWGGIRIGSVVDRQLRGLGVEPKQHPGLFKQKAGRGSIDTIVLSEHPILAENLADAGNGYADPDALLNAISEELGGNPLRTAQRAMEISNDEALTENAQQWLKSVGLDENSSVKEVRDFVRSIQGNEKNIGGLDTRIETMERDLEAFDNATDKLRSERDISAAEAKDIADEIADLEAKIAPLADQANSSPVIGMMADYATTNRKLFKRKMAESNMRKRVSALERIEREGKATDEILMELAAKKIDLAASQTEIAKLSAKSNMLREKLPTARQAEKVDEFSNLSDAEVRELVDETINSLIGNAEGRIPYDSIVSGPRGPLKQRTLNIESEKIKDFLNLDVEEVLRAQVRTMSADIEIAKKFGSVDMAEQVRQINDEAVRKIGAAASDAERIRLEAARKSSVRDIEAMRDRIRGQYALPSNPDGIVLRANRVVRNLNYLRLLGGMTVSAIPDMGRIVFTHGLTSSFKDGFVPLVTNFRKFRLAAEEVKQAGTALDMVLDSRTMAMADITGEFGRHSKFERGIHALSSKFGVVSLMAPWNASMKQFSGMVVMTNILRSARNVAAGTATSGEIRRLAQSNIDADMAQRISSMFEKHGDNEGDVWLAKAANWEDIAAQETFRGAVVRDVDRIVVSPGQDKPLWMSTELGKTVGQFKSFSVSAMQRITLAGLQQRDAAALNGLIVTMGLGAVSYGLSQKIAGRDVSDDPRVWAVNAFDRSGLAGWMMEGNNIMEKATRGRVGLSALTGQEVSRYASRNVTSAFLGPTPGTIADIFAASGSIFAGDFARPDLNKMRQMIPAQNLFYTRWLFNQMEKSTGDALDLPEKKER